MNVDSVYETVLYACAHPSHMKQDLPPRLNYTKHRAYSCVCVEGVEGGGVGGGGW